MEVGYNRPLCAQSEVGKLLQTQIELRDLGCERDERWLFSQLNAEFSSATITQVAGPNGCGKTTLLRVLTSLSSDFTGSILWRGRPMAEVRFDFLQNLLYLGHQPGIKRALTPLDNLNWYANLGGRVAGDPMHALAKAGLAGYENFPCHQLSAGQLRRVALARLFLSQAPLWILDEPFTAIDKNGVAHIENALAEHCRGGGTVILTTHQPLEFEGLRTLDLAAYRGSNKPSGIRHHA